MAEPIQEYLITSHAVVEMKRLIVHRVLIAPEQSHSVRTGRDVLQSRITFGDKVYLVRVFVDVDRKPADVVTVYRTAGAQGTGERNRESHL
jgi:hypothetical protein